MTRQPNVEADSTRIPNIVIKQRTRIQYHLAGSSNHPRIPIGGGGICLHGNDGAALSASQFGELPLTKRYVDRYQTEMCRRKGVLIQSQISKGSYWSLIGVGPYSFTKYKIAWESLGKREFRAVVLDGHWQGNQAMHAYIPSSSPKDARRICAELNESVPAYLKAFGMEGTCNWAQPGRIKRLLVEQDIQPNLL